MEGLRRNIRSVSGLGLRLTRVAILLVVVLVAVLGFAGYRAKAQVGEHLLTLGMKMMRYAPAERQDAPRLIHLNGQAMFMSSGLTHEPLEKVLDEFESRCLSHDGQLFQQFEDVSASQDVPVDTAWYKPLVRAESGSSGVIACIDLGEEQMSTGELLDRFERFQKSRDLGDIGDARYVYAERTKKGDTHFVGFWTEGSFRLGEVFPEKGDAAGVDPEGVPRPPTVRRLLSAWEEGTKQVVTVYGDSDASPKLMREYYRTELPKAGWHVLAQHPRIPRKVEPGQQIMMAEQGQRQIGVIVSQDRAGKTQATVLTFQ